MSGRGSARGSDLWVKSRGVVVALEMEVRKMGRVIWRKMKRRNDNVDNPMVGLLPAP